MKTLIIFMSVLITYGESFAQTTKKAPIKPTKSEIDRLCDKYKGKEYLTLYTPYGNIVAEVLINYNNDDKPESIVLSGSSENLKAIAYFVSNLIKQKLEQGYIEADEVYSWEMESLVDSGGHGDFYFSKKQMYFRAKLENDFSWNHSDNNQTYFYTLETGDQSRFGGKKAFKFEF